MNNSVEVLHLMTGFGGGISSFIKNKADFFKMDEDVLFNVLTFDEVSEDFHNSIINTGGKIYKVTDPKDSFSSFVKETSNIFNEIPKDTVIHCHFGMNLALYFKLLVKKNNIKRFIIHAHTDAPKEVRESLKNKFRRYFNSKMTREKLSCGTGASINIFGKKDVDNNNIVHIPNSIDPFDFIYNKFSIEEKTKLLGKENKDKFIIGNIGRFHPQKNHLFMLDLIEKLSVTNLDFLWIFIGDGELKDKIENEAEKRNLSKYILFLGRRSDVPALLNIMDLFVLPSLYEGLPTVAVEAQAAGIPCLLSTEITEEVDLGMGIVRFLDLEDMDSWMESIVESTELKRVSEKRRLDNLVEKKFTNEESGKLYKQFLLEKISYYNL
ncbi:Glycosyltransferase involved in cell wall bisynthesis [Atopostipes suicloacalis DSM 15692]|uniref:Glycosyltransferase involved in cell wall bisynthesis n=1 Tax=Atopostipes suicloacalis DSM 15692 TaxID=1121025 RepID=A0A1M4X251_9LACT|nr:glycosyltransferase [Atopostipes suicloacalis]SHE87598.1 Glycosyltransferase involved in cell wall bisynthesis [Atopostipes suicloacalis DSM 15692]